MLQGFGCRQGKMVYTILLTEARFPRASAIACGTAFFALLLNCYSVFGFPIEELSIANQNRLAEEDDANIVDVENAKLYSQDEYMRRLQSNVTVTTTTTQAAAQIVTTQAVTTIPPLTGKRLRSEIFEIQNF